jgi:AraC-like DNA-binding protein
MISTPTLAAVPNATEHLDMVWDADSPHLVVYLPRLAIDRAVESLTARTPISPVRFKLAMDLDTAAARRWLSLIDVLKVDADSAVVPLHDAVRAQIEDAIMLAFVTTQTSNCTELISAGTHSATPRAIRRAMRLCDESPDVTWTVTDLAAASGVSVRSLQVGFRTYVGLTPLQYLRDVRLLRAREELESDSGAAVSVTDTAFRWGFSNVGRFASEYRARFGELPSQTVARSGKPVLKSVRESSRRCA